MPRIPTAIVQVLPVVLRAGQKFGVNITPAHFYSEIPDMAHLRRETYWRKPWSMVGVQGADIDPQVDRLRAWAKGLEEALGSDQIHRAACERNGEVGFGPIEAPALYAFARANRPGRVVQVGCGVSTAVLLQAANDDPAWRPQITCIEPYPTDFLRKEASRGRIRLIPEMAQCVELENLTALDTGDLFFVDSTHTVKPGSEVLRIIFDVLPQLAPGVFVHFHDIYFPYDYPPGLFKAAFIGRESPLLHAFLCMNSSYAIAVSLSMLHHARPEKLREVFPAYNPRPTKDGLAVGEGHYPSSTYLVRVS